MRYRSRKRFTIGAIALALAGSSVAMTVTAPPAQAASLTLTFLNINDFHGRIDSNTEAFAATIEQQRLDAAAASSPVALLAAGDLVGGSLFASAIQQDQPAIEVLNALALDASSVGNHEFDKGFADLRDRIIGPSATPNAKWNYLGANVYLKGTTTPALAEYKVLTMGTVTVGVIGVVTDDTDSLVSPEGITTLDFGDPVDAVNRVALQLSDGNPVNGEADFIVAEFHEGAPFGDGAGVPGTLDSNQIASPIFQKIVTQTSAHVDVIFTGHTHQEYEYNAPIPGVPGKFRPILETGEYGNKIGKVTLTVDDVTKTVTSYTIANVTRIATPTPAQKAFPRVVAVKAITDAAITFAAAKGSVPVGSLTADITTAFTGAGAGYVNGVYTAPTRDDRSKESTLGNLVADALLDQLSPANRGGAQITVVNPGGLRAELLFAPDGVITTKEANDVLPFGNDLRTTTLTGAQFKLLLEQQWQRDSANTVPSRPYLQLGLSDNVTYTFDATLPEGSRITSIAIDGVPINPAGTYRVGTFSFLITGGDNFRAFLQGANTTDSGTIDRDAWISSLSENAPVSPDFARQAVAASGLPTSVTAGTNVTLALSALDLTSLGSPQNTSVEVFLGGVSLGVAPVTNGAVSVNLAVPATVPSGLQPLQVVASPTNTTTTIAVTVSSSGPAKPYKPLIFAQDDAVEVAPQRLVDSRDGTGIALAKLTAFKEYKLVVAGKFGIAATAEAVAVNLTTTNSGLPGFINVYPCGGTVNPVASAVNQFPGKIVANLAIVDIGLDGAICFVSNDATDLIVDLQTWFPADSDLQSITPTRIVDTRSGLGIPNKLGSNMPVELKVTGVNGVPANASAVLVNMTMTDSNAGFKTAFTCGTITTLASNLNAWPGKAIANLAIVAVGNDGKICLTASDTTHLVVDLQGFYPAGADYNSMTPVRALDTRSTSTPLESNVFREVKIAGLFGVPNQADLVAVNVTAVDATGDAFITVYPCGPLPTVSSGNTSPDRIVATLALVNLSSTGSICVLSNLRTDLVIDVQGWQG